MKPQSPSKPTAEILSGIFAEEQHAQDPARYPAWADLSAGDRAATMHAMHAVIDTLGAFGFTITRGAHGLVCQWSGRTDSNSRPPSHPVLDPPEVAAGLLAPGGLTPADVRTLGFTGDACLSCQGMQMVRNGSCLKCVSCGTTTGCS